jgi:cytochrome b561
MDVAVKDRYDSVTRGLHWLLAFLIIAEYLIALVMDDFGIKWLHLQIGYCILGLVILRIIWKLTHKAPPMDSSLTRLNQILAHSGHGVMYLLMLIIPLLGVTLVVIRGMPFNVFGISIEPLMNPLVKATRHNIKQVHEYLAHTLIILVSMHALVALLHQFVLGHPILSRMLPEKLANIIENKNGKK